MYLKILLLTACLFFYHFSKAQIPVIECSELMRKNAKAKVDPLLLEQRRNELGARASLPYTIRTNVVVFYKNNPTVTNADIIRNITNMANFYRSHNICFTLTGIEFIKDSALADFHTDNESMLAPYIHPYQVTIFVHTYLNSSIGLLNGMAYEIPNNYLSIVDDAVLSNTNISTLAHEMGHCFGLYHTFENFYGVERRARSGDCKNCETTGDYLCDTEADRNVAESSISTACVYTGTLQDNCDNTALVMEPRNIMTYGRRACRNTFTNGQGARARDHILAETMLYNSIAPDVITVTNNINYTGGTYSLTAKNNITINSPSYNITGNAKMEMIADRISILPGAVFRPNIISTGKTIITTNPFCQ